MRIATALAASLLALAPSQCSAQNNVLSLGVTRGLPNVRVGAIPQSLGKRATYTETLVNNITGGGYYASVSVGTPPQPQTMVLDTGSSDAWVVSYLANLCTSVSTQERYGDTCSQTYNGNKSSTYKLVSSKGFSIQYLDQSTISGDYITDDFTIGGATVQNLQMGLATKTVRGVGILGIGFSANVATTKKYPNIIDMLYSQGVIGIQAYSLWLNDRRSDSGTILFGGIDTDKFIGNLEVLPILETQSSSGVVNYTTLAVSMGAFGASFANGTGSNFTKNSANIPAILDTGTTLAYLPDTIATQLFDMVGAVTDYKQTGLTFIDCDYLSDPSRAFTLSFSFNKDQTLGGGATITVPVEEMVLDVLGGYDNLIPGGVPFDNTCLFGIQSTAGFEQSSATTSNYALLGDTFLRSAYLVYDLTHKQIGIAQANLNSTDSNVVELAASGSALPTTFVGVAAQQTTATGAAVSTATRSGSSSTGSATNTAGGTHTSSGGSGQTTVTVTAGATTSSSAAAPGRAGSGAGAGGFAVAALASLFALVGAALFVV